MCKFEISGVNDIIEVEGIHNFNTKHAEGYRLLAVGVHTDVLDQKGNTRLSTIFTMGRNNL